MTQAFAELGVESVQMWLIPMQLHLMGLVGRINPTYIADYRKGLKHHTDDQLREILKAGTELLWTEKPSYYHALAEEIGSRNMV